MAHEFKFSSIEKPDFEMSMTISEDATVDSLVYVFERYLIAAGYKPVTLTWEPRK